MKYNLKNFSYYYMQKLLSLKPVVRTRRSYKRAGLIKRQSSSQGLAMYGHGVMMSLQKRAKLFGTHFLSEIAVKSCCVFVRKPYSCRSTFPATYNEFRLKDSHNVLLNYRFK
jgi:hypothetical protein